MKNLVTGGAGFLGSHLCDVLLARGEDVICLDDLSTGQYCNLAHLEGHKNFSFIRADVCDPIDVSVDRIFNFACPASPVAYQRDPVKTLMTNVNGALNMLTLAEKCNATIIQASTSEIYGDPLQHPQQETYWGNVNPIGIRACYDEGKRAAETLFFDFYRTRSVNIKIARIFNTYGPKMSVDDGRAVSNFIVQALMGKTITIFGDGSQTRSFCFVDDLINGIVALADSPKDMTGPFNIGNPHEISLTQLASEVLLLTKSKSAVSFLPLPADDPKMRCPDIRATREALSWSPTTTLHDGLEKTIRYFQSVLLPA